MDMRIEKMKDGSFVLSDRADNGSLFHIRYYFYSLKQAKKLFKEALKEYNAKSIVEV